MLAKKALETERAKERQGTRADLAPEDIRENLPQSSKGKTRDKLAKEAGVSGRTFDKTDYVERHAPEKVKEKARVGKLSVDAAYKTVAKKECKQALEHEQVIDYTPIN